MNEHTKSSSQLPICETLHVGVNRHGMLFPSGTNNNNSTSSSSSKNKPLIQDVRDQLPPRRNATHIILRRDVKQSLVLQSISLDANDVAEYFQKNNSNINKTSKSSLEDFTITIYCQRAPFLCEPIEDTPTALCTLKPSAGIISHHFENKGFHPRNNSVEFGVSVNLFAVVKRIKKVNTITLKNADVKESGKRRSRTDEEEEEKQKADQNNSDENNSSSSFTFKIHILGYIAQPVSRLVSYQLWKRLDELSARHQLFEDEPSMRGLIKDDFASLREDMAKRLHNPRYALMSNNSENVFRFGDEDKKKHNKRKGRKGRRGGGFDDDDDNSYESDDDIRNLRDILASDNDDDSLVQSDDETTASLVSSRDGSDLERAPASSDDDDEEVEDLEEGEESDDDDDEEGEDYDYDGFENDDEEDESGNDDGNEDDEESDGSGSSSDDVYHNESRPRAWRYRQRQG